MRQNLDPNKNTARYVMKEVFSFQNAQYGIKVHKSLAYNELHIVNSLLLRLFRERPPLPPEKYVFSMKKNYARYSCCQTAARFPSTAK